MNQAWKNCFQLVLALLGMALLSGCISWFVGPDPIPGSVPYVPSQADSFSSTTAVDIPAIPPVPVYDGNGNQVGGF